MTGTPGAGSDETLQTTRRRGGVGRARHAKEPQPTVHRARPDRRRKGYGRRRSRPHSQVPRRDTPGAGPHGSRGAGGQAIRAAWRPQPQRSRRSQASQPAWAPGPAHRPGTASRRFFCRLAAQALAVVRAASKYSVRTRTAKSAAQHSKKGSAPRPSASMAPARAEPASDSRSF